MCRSIFVVATNVKSSSVTANAAEANKQEAMANGFTDYVSIACVSLADTYLRRD